MNRKANTLNNILDWEENTNYYYKGNIYKIVNNILFVYNINKDCFVVSELSINNLTSLRRGSITQIRHHYKLKKEYNITNNEDYILYLNKIRDSDNILLSTAEDSNLYQTTFTVKEYERLMNINELNKNMFERVDE